MADVNQLVRTMKPTGDAECPPHVERAHQIEWLMNEKAGTRDLDDSEIIDLAGDINDDDDAPISISSDDDEHPPATSSKKTVSVKIEPDSTTLGPIARRANSNRLQTPARLPRASRTTPLDLLNSISRSLDPGLNAARDEDRSAR